MSQRSVLTMILLYNKNPPDTLSRVGRFRSLEGGVGLFRFYYNWVYGHWWFHVHMVLVQFMGLSHKL